MLTLADMDASEPLLARYCERLNPRDFLAQLRVVSTPEKLAQCVVSKGAWNLLKISVACRCPACVLAIHTTSQNITSKVSDAIRKELAAVDAFQIDLDFTHLGCMDAGTESRDMEGVESDPLADEKEDLRIFEEARIQHTQEQSHSQHLSTRQKEDPTPVLTEALQLLPNLARVHFESYWLNHDKPPGFQEVAEFGNALNALQGLTELGFRNAGDFAQFIPAVVEKLVNHSSLRHLTLENNKLDVRAARLLSSCLPTWPKLETVWLGHNPLTPAGVAMVAGALQAHSALQRLHLGGTHMGSVGAVALARVLPGLRHLRFLDLVANDIDALGMEAIAASLGNLTMLNWLRLETCDRFLFDANDEPNVMGLNGMAVLGRSLGFMPDLQRLDVGHLRIDPAGFRALAPNLKTRSKLEELDLSCNRLGDAAGEELATVLQGVGPHLKTLKLGDNKLGDETASSMSLALATCTQLEELVMEEGNLIKEGPGATSFAYAVHGLMEDHKLKDVN